MDRFSCFRVFVALACALVASGIDTRAQQVGGRHLGSNMKYSSGQTVQPIFDGWSRNADGTFTMHFGYLNRNHVEELHVPIGPENMVEPAGPDGGQPTYFYTRFNRRAFTVVVPRDFGKKEVVWTLTTHGKSEQAIGILQADWEVDGSSMRYVADNASNAAPTLDIAASVTRLASAGSVMLTATVKDDGLPRPAAPTRRSTDGVPAFQHEKSPGTPTNLPQIERVRRRVDGRLSVTWIVWRGPAPVAFDPPIVGADKGPTTVTASFGAPGTYVLRALASDRLATTRADVTITVGNP